MYISKQSHYVISDSFKFKSAIREEFLIMVDNKKKVVSGVVAATALTGTFVAPATAQAADNDAPNSIQETIQEATQAQKAAKTAPQKVKAAKSNFDKVNRNAQRAIKAAKGAITNAQKNVDKYEPQVEGVKEDWDTKIVTAQQAQQKADQTGKQSDINKANRAKKNVENAQNTYQKKKAELDRRQNVVKDKQNNLLTVKQEQNAKVKAAQDAYSQAQAEQQQAIKMANSTKKAAAGAWGNWDNTHTVEDYSTDISGFQNLIDDYFQPLVQKERLAIGAQEVQAQRLDANRLFLKHDHEMRVWFINEGAGYRNQLAYEATKGDDYQKGMIFDDIACKGGCQLNNLNDGALDIGDFVDLGLIEGGTQLNFLLKADGATENTNKGDIFGADESLNSDGLQHLMAFEVNAGGRDYLMMGFEDIRGGGDLDYNDAVFVVDFGEGNLTDTATPTRFAQAATVPEASNIAAIFGVTGAGLMLRRRRRNKK